MAMKWSPVIGRPYSAKWLFSVKDLEQFMYIAGTQLIRDIKAGFYRTVYVNTKLHWTKAAIKIIYTLKCFYRRAGLIEICCEIKGANRMSN